MKSKKYMLLIAIIIAFSLLSCKKKEEKKSSREYITESGFSFETSIEETKAIVTKPYDIKKHPEDWTMTNKETYKYILMALFDKYSNEYNYSCQNNYEKLPLSEYFRTKFDLSKYGLGLFTIEYEVEDGDDVIDRVGKFDATDEEFENNEVWCYRSNYVYFSKLKLKYYLDENNYLNDIQILEPEIITENIRENEIDYDAIEYDVTLEDIANGIPNLIIGNNVKFINERYEATDFCKCTDDFINNYNPEIGIIPQHQTREFYNAEINTNYSDFDNNIFAYNVELYLPNTFVVDENNPIIKKYLFHTKLDDRNFLDSITKIEEILEDGSVVELEDNYGK